MGPVRLRRPVRGRRGLTIDPAAGFELRTRHADPAPLLGLIAAALLIYTFAGACVYQAITGSTTVGVGGRVSNLGGLVWLGPLVVGTAIILIGDRRPFRRLFLPRARIVATVDDLVWSAATGAGSVPWAEVGGVSSVGDGPGRSTTVYGLVGEPLVELRGEFEDERTGDRRPVPVRILEVRPDRYEPADPSRPGDGCVQRSLSDGRRRSAP